MTLYLSACRSSARRAGTRRRSRYLQGEQYTLKEGLGVLPDMKEAVMEAQIPPRSSIRQNSDAWRRIGEERGKLRRKKEMRKGDRNRGTFREGEGKRGEEGEGGGEGE